jgi:shikimate dehydrogenase
MSEWFLLGLVGYPLGHSISPALHGAALRAAGLAGEYRLYEIPPLPEGSTALADLLEMMGRGQLHGLNVTIPHKQSLLPYLNDCLPAARQIGAVNVVFYQEGRLLGDNTDAEGFQRDLEVVLADAGRPDRGQAVVLGAGGSARAIVYALQQAGWAITVAARRIEQAQALGESFSEGEIRAVVLDGDGLRSAGEVDLIVNTTPTGMHPQPAASPWPKNVPLPGHAVVYDLVYNPSTTRLVEAAREAGLKATSGLGMLVEQAALSFERWTGHSADRQAMTRAAVGALNAKGTS